jgi:hypothetical protein
VENPQRYRKKGNKSKRKKLTKKETRSVKSLVYNGFFLILPLDIQKNGSAFVFELAKCVFTAYNEGMLIKNY